MRGRDTLNIAGFVKLFSEQGRNENIDVLNSYACNASRPALLHMNDNQQVESFREFNKDLVVFKCVENHSEFSKEHRNINTSKHRLILFVN